jgi:hypothetical protein
VAAASAALVLAGLAACVAPLSYPGKTSTIQLVSTSVVSGYRVEHYRNTAYPCSISGHQTFTIGYPEGLARTAARPLWVTMHGGAAGWFDATGTPRPDDQSMREEDLESFLALAARPGITPLVLGDAAGFRVMGVSMCNRDLYGGGNLADPDNPNRQPDGKVVTTNGLFATKAAIAFARERFTTTKTFLHGESAGSLGAYGLAWAFEQQGAPVAGIVADGGPVNREWMDAVLAQGVACPVVGPFLAHADDVARRVHPVLADRANESHRLVTRGDLRTPVAQVWSHDDPWTCGDEPMACPLPDGSTPVMGASGCANEPLRGAIAAQGPAGRSRSFGLCVAAATPCGMHVVTSISGTNTDPAFPADYNATIMAWVHARLGDP